MKDSFDERALEILRRSQRRKLGDGVYIYISPFWLTSKIEDESIIELPEFLEFSELSGKISFCGIDADISIYRMHSESGWSIECKISSGEPINCGNGFLTDEDAFESLVRSLVDNSLNRTKFAGGSNS